MIDNLFRHWYEQLEKPPSDLKPALTLNICQWFNCIVNFLTIQQLNKQKVTMPEFQFAIFASSICKSQIALAD